MQLIIVKNHLLTQPAVALNLKKDASLALMLNKKNKLKQLILWLTVFAWMGAIFYFSSVPGKNIPLLFPFQDAVFHIAVYAILGFLFIRSAEFTFLNLTPLKLLLFSLFFGTLYGIIDEFHQSFVPNRYPAGFDVFTDSLGTLLGSLTQLFLWHFIFFRDDRDKIF